MPLPRGFESRILTAFIAAAFVVLSLTALTWQLARDTAAAALLVDHTQGVMIDLARVRSDTVQIELSTQGFRITGDPARLRERDLTIASRELLLKRIERLTADNPTQQDRWRQLRQVIDERLDISQRVEHLRKTQGQEAANAFVATAPLQATRNRTHALLDLMEAEERDLLKTRYAAQTSAHQQALWVGLVVSLLLIGLLVGTYRLVHRQISTADKSRRALLDNEKSLSTTLDSIGDGVIVTDPTGHITRMNPIAAQWTGWVVPDALTRPLSTVFCVVDASTDQPLLIARDGAARPISHSTAPIRDGHGLVLGAVTVFRDDTASRQARQTVIDQNAWLEQRVLARTNELEESKGHLLNVINSVPALIAYVDASQHYVYVNQQYRDRFAPGYADITGLSVREILGEDRYAIASPLIAKVLKGDPQSYDWQPFQDVWQVINYVPHRDPSGLVSGYYVLGTDITERRHTQEALSASQQQLTRVLDGTDQGYWDWDLQTNAFHVSPRWESMLGYGPGEMRTDGASWPAIVHPDDLPLALASIERNMTGEASSHELEIRCRTKEGDWRWILTRGRIVARSAQGQPLMMSGTHTDITERKQLELAQMQAAVVFAHSYEGIIVANAEQVVIQVNPGYTRITGFSEKDTVGRSLRDLSCEQHDLSTYNDFFAHPGKSDFWSGEVSHRRQSGESLIALQSLSLVRDGQGNIQHYVSVFADISQLKAHEAELDRVANYDSLTQLPNRRLLADRLSQAIRRSERSGKLTAVCFLDLDGFKAINDQHGHAVGDAVLISTATHLGSVLRAGDTLARLGGDEFVLLLTDVSNPHECALILERMLQAVSLPITTHNTVLTASASIGVTLFPDDNADPDTLLRHADQAMYLAKQAGKNRYQLFDPDIDRRAQQRRSFLGELYAALLREEFVLYYQPKVDLISGEVLGVEALIRWNNPRAGLQQPCEFLPQMAGSDLERPFGVWVIETALRQAQRWLAAGQRIKISVNISATHLLQSDFCDSLARALAHHPDIAPEDLELEVLETAAIGDMQQAVAILTACRALGVRFSLDDFGTGYSSLTYLRKLPVHTLKIDQSFVRDMLSDPDDLGIVRGVIELAGAFQREVIAEGVETLEHGTRLREMGCHIGQGYGIARPMPAEQFLPWRTQWLASQAWLGH
jgi:diguanylate cyclase (GGDEF)-like protein/PAS domain S-box-containing protein